MIEHLKNELEKSIKQDRCTNFIKEMLDRVKGGEQVHEFLLANGTKYSADIWVNYPFVDVYRDEPTYFKLEPKRAYRPCKDAIEACKFIGKHLVNIYAPEIVYHVIAVSNRGFYCNSKFCNKPEYTFKDMFNSTLVQHTKEQVGVLE